MARGSLERTQQRLCGEIDTLPSRSLRVKVYAGSDPINGKRHYLTEATPAGRTAAEEAEKARNRLLVQVDERRNPRARATLDLLANPSPRQWHRDGLTTSCTCRAGLQHYDRPYSLPGTDGSSRAVAYKPSTGELVGIKRLAAIGSALGIGIMMTVPGVANAANSGCVYEGSDRACFINLSNGQAQLEVCDNEADGNGVYAWFYSGIYHTASIKVGDGNGSSAGCGTRVWSVGVYDVKICEDDAGEDTCRWFTSS
ncbi:hypothetical protein AB0J94_10385 [Micromonospora noduli]|uniref:hypothetical protein n=1 Tax=Micromonospora noduli TaxID=709876 RepID=UPI00343A4BC7